MMQRKVVNATPVIVQTIAVCPSPKSLFDARIVDGPTREDYHAGLKVKEV